jgi:hypothetical protein
VRAPPTLSCCVAQSITLLGADADAPASGAGCGRSSPRGAARSGGPAVAVEQETWRLGDGAIASLYAAALDESERRRRAGRGVGGDVEPTATRGGDVRAAAAGALAYLSSSSSSQRGGGACATAPRLSVSVVAAGGEPALGLDAFVETALEARLVPLGV